MRWAAMRTCTSTFAEAGNQARESAAARTLRASFIPMLLGLLRGPHEPLSPPPHKTFFFRLAGCSDPVLLAALACSASATAQSQKTGFNEMAVTGPLPSLWSENQYMPGAF